jgi:hypothetical protein
MDLIEKWKQGKKENKGELKNFLFSPMIKSIEDLDQKAKSIHEEVVQEIDCLDCGNCCKTTVTTFTESDINRIAKFVNIPKKEFIKIYLIDDMGEYTTVTTPCPFLEEDNKCAIYEVRPEACSSYPHTHRKGFIARRNAHVANVEVCPITYNLLMRIMDEMQYG